MTALRTKTRTTEHITPHMSHLLGEIPPPLLGEIPPPLLSSLLLTRSDGEREETRGLSPPCLTLFPFSWPASPKSQETSPLRWRHSFFVLFCSPKSGKKNHSSSCTNFASKISASENFLTVFLSSLSLLVSETLVSM